MISMLLAANTCVSVEALAGRLGVSKRTVYYDMKKINDWLKDKKLTEVRKKHGKGYYLEEAVKEKAEEMFGGMVKIDYIYSPEERLALIAVKLLTSTAPVFLDELMEICQVSKGTASADLKELKHLFSEGQLRIAFTRNHGYVIHGQETRKRQLLVHYLSQLMENKHGWEDIFRHIHLSFHDNDLNTEGIYVHLQSIKAIIADCEQELANEFTDEMVHLLALQLIVMIQRLLQGYRIRIDREERKALRSTPEYRAAVNMARRLEHVYRLSISDSEICFFTMHLLGSKVNYSDLEAAQNDEMEKLKQVVKEIIHIFQSYACLLIRDVSRFEETLFTHLKPAYYRIKYNVSAKDGSAQKLKEHFKEIFWLTKKSVSPLEDLLGKTIADAEIAYIAMHFGGWLQRAGKKPVKRKKAFIVCENGLGTSNILWGQLEKLMTTVDIAGCISKRQYESKEYEADYIFSTTFLTPQKQPVLVVNPILSDQDKQAVLSFINQDDGAVRALKTPSPADIMNAVRKYATIHDERKLMEELTAVYQEHAVTTKREEKPVLKELLTKEMIQYQETAGDWKAAIRLAAAPLIKNGSITHAYVQAMIANVEELGPYVVIAPGIALPHARPEQGVNKLGMSLLRLKESVYFSEQEKHRARLIIVLAAVDNEKHLRALSQLMTMLSDEAVLQQILTAESSGEIIGYIDQYSLV
nr:BglG family transcription antiterminator [Evansella caseinilytica]